MLMSLIVQENLRLGRLMVNFLWAMTRCRLLLLPMKYLSDGIIGGPPVFALSSLQLGLLIILSEVVYLFGTKVNAPIGKGRVVRKRFGDLQ